MSSSETAFLPVKVQISFGSSSEVSLLQKFFFQFCTFKINIKAAEKEDSRVAQSAYFLIKKRKTYSRFPCDNMNSPDFFFF